MKKQNLILFGILAIILSLGSLGTFKAGSGHIEVVKDNVTLVKTNSILKKENAQLIQENQELKVMTDSLTSKLEPKLEPKIKIHEPKKENSSITPIDTDVYIREYKLTVPIEEISGN